ncbi:MAG: YqgE/AlgH family protein [Alysiella sp.]|uniref:YqgE/AlgH family protein n=1 Tax=Alysiella sp. TaxID=1872483 RepID=UPI0026DAE582|nr:YqgE/AlgH family protein [Alysiella sp.]MDO4433313.1 YqgE/AlgH family protein [Alysiella sp.]
MTQLTHHFLIAMPTLQDPFFSNSVVWICEHDVNGAMGIIINKPTPISMNTVFADAPQTIGQSLANRYVMLGGPIEIERGFVVHTPIGHWHNTVMVDAHTGVTTSRDIIEHISLDDNAVEAAFLAIGYSSWSAGQLEQELANNVWLTLPADHQILFHTPPEDCYKVALAKLGIRPEMLITIGGKHHV